MPFKLSKIHAKLQKVIRNRLFPKNDYNLKEEKATASIIEIHDKEHIEINKKRIVVMSRCAVSRYNFKLNDILISISDSDMTTPELEYTPLDVLSLSFNDYVTEYGSEKYNWREMDSADGNNIIKFISKHKDCNDIVIHCNLGESRSKGAALAISKITNRPVFHISDTKRITEYVENEYSYFNKHVYKLILTEHKHNPETASN